MKILSKDGRVGYRTKLLPPMHAETFAECLKANSIFEHVEVVQSSRRENAYFVAYKPSNDYLQQLHLLEAEQARYDRAYRDSRDYTYTLKRGYFECLSKSGNTYDVTMNTCNCGDFINRCQGNGIFCKHILGLYIAVQEGRVNE